MVPFPVLFHLFPSSGLCGWNFVIGFFLFSFILFFLFSFFGVSDICPIFRRASVRHTFLFRPAPSFLCFFCFCFRPILYCTLCYTPYADICLTSSGLCPTRSFSYFFIVSFFFRVGPFPVGLVCCGFRAFPPLYFSSLLLCLSVWNLVPCLRRFAAFLLPRWRSTILLLVPLRFGLSPSGWSVAASSLTRRCHSLFAGPSVRLWSFALPGALFLLLCSFVFPVCSLLLSLSLLLFRLRLIPAALFLLCLF